MPVPLNLILLCQMLWSCRHSDLVVLAGTVNGFTVGAGHAAADHSHSAADLQDGTVDMDFRS
jgi:hypothetical protein